MTGQIFGDAVTLIGRLHYNLVEFSHNGDLYMVDKTIDSEPIGYYIWYSRRDKQYSVSLYGKGFIININTTSLGHQGIFNMEYDLGLSLESCMGLYDYNLEVLCGDECNNPYNRLSIERQWAIKNIINDEA